MNSYCVVTTINKPTKAIEVLYEKFGSNLIIVGDKKTLADWNYKNAQYILDLPREKTWYEGYAPANHYARKNLGYLEAMRRGADVIYSTDDDNCPNENWTVRKEHVETPNATHSPGWFNFYRSFVGKKIWPRGFSLRELSTIGIEAEGESKTSSIQQGMADGEPDVDAIYRLVGSGRTNFHTTKSVYLNKKTCIFFHYQ